MKVVKYVACVLCSLLVAVTATSCHLVEFAYTLREKEYYSNRDNFVSVEAVCVEISTNKWFPELYFITVKDMEYELTNECRFISATFKVDEANASILRNNDVEAILTEGTKFTFISAPEYFGDGYSCPIVGLEVDGNVLLDFDTGYKNLMDTYKWK